MTLRRALVSIALFTLLTPARSFANEAREIPQDLMAAVQRARYAIHDDGPEPWATNYAQQLRARFEEEGARITLRGEKDSIRTPLALHLSSWGIEGSMRPAGPSHRVVSTTLVAYGFNGITEWWKNSTAGIEHGFQIPARPVGDRSRPLVLDVELEGGWTAHGDGDALTFRAPDGTRLHYGKLAVVDAKGKAIVASLGTKRSAIRITVADAEAVYPLSIDPLITNHEAQLFATGGAAGDDFGYSVSINGETAVIGAIGDDTARGTDAGSAYVFVQNGGVWSQQAQLFATPGAANDQFGSAVSVSGETAVVGSKGDDTAGGADAGSAYVFVRSGGNWSQEAQLFATDGWAGDLFGSSISLSGETAVIGAYFDDTAAGADAGSAYVFVRSGAIWIQEAQLLANNGASADQFGYSVSVSGETAVIGARLDNTAGGIDAGSAYVFVRSGGIWSQQAQLLATGAAARAEFGISVGVSGETAVVGANGDNTAGFGAGSAYVFVRSGAIWSQQAKLLATGGAAGASFGKSVSVSGETVVVGANSAAYVFIPSGGIWSQQAQLSATGGEAGDVFGASVSVDGDAVVVGAYFDDTAAGVNAGSAHIFRIVRLNNAPTANGQSMSTAEDTSVAINLTGSDSDGDALSYAIAMQPAKGTLSCTGANCTYTPNPNLNGADSFTFTVSDGTATSAPATVSITITPVNDAPLIGAAPAPTRVQGSAGSVVPIATVSDAEDAAGSLIVTTTSIPAGLSVTGITNANGMISATVAADCGATPGANSVGLRVEDSGGLASMATLTVNVTANKAPALGTYDPVTLLHGGSVVVAPSAPPDDDGSIASITASAPGFTGTLAVDPSSGAVSVGNASPSGAHEVTITATDNCGAMATSSLTVTVTVPRISVNDVSVPEGSSGTTNALFTVTLSGASSQTVSVSYATLDGTATEGIDYTAASGTLTFDPAVTSLTVAVPVLGDETFEPDEAFSLELSNAVNGSLFDGHGVATIANDDSRPSVSIADATISEGNGGVTGLAFTALLSNPSSETVTVAYATSDGTASAGADYSATSGTLMFAPGVTAQTLTVSVHGDFIHELNETLTATLSNPTAATLGDETATGTIVDDDGPPSITIDDVNVLEGDSEAANAVLTVTLSNPSSSTVLLDYATADGTATAGSDYVATTGTLTFAPGAALTQTVPVAVEGDPVPEPDESFTVSLSGAVNGAITDGTGIVTIQNDDAIPSEEADVAVSQSASGTTFSPGQQVTFKVLVTNYGPDGASGVTMTDTLGTGMTFVAAKTTRGTCSGRGPIVCELGKLRSAETAIISLLVRVSTAGPSTNRVVVTSDVVDPVLKNNRSALTINVKGMQPQ